MNKSMKYIIPLTIIFACATTSCGKSSGHLNRETYEIEVKTLEELVPTFEIFKNNQYEDTLDGEGRVIKTQYHTPEKGTITSNINIALNGSLRFLDSGYDIEHADTLDLNNITALIQDQITTKWDFSHNDYFSCTNKNGKSYFIQREGEGEEAVWKKYYNTLIGGKKYYFDITDDVKLFGGFANYVMYQIAASSGYFNDENYDGDYPIMYGVGLGISGFGGDIFKDTARGISVHNLLAPAILFEPKFTIEIPISEGKVINLSIREIVDFICTDEPLVKILPIKTKYTTNDARSAASVSIDCDNFDLNNSKALIDEIIKELEEESTQYTLNGNGTCSANYFVNFKDNFIHQFELSLELNHINLQFFTASAHGITYINLKDVYTQSYVNETFDQGVCDYQEPDITDYEPAI